MQGVRIYVGWDRLTTLDVRLDLVQFCYRPGVAIFLQQKNICIYLFIYVCIYLFVYLFVYFSGPHEEGQSAGCDQQLFTHVSSTGM